MRDGAKKGPTKGQFGGLQYRLGGKTTSLHSQMNGKFHYRQRMWEQLVGQNFAVDKTRKCGGVFSGVCPAKNATAESMSRRLRASLRRRRLRQGVGHQGVGRVSEEAKKERAMAGVS